MATLLKDKFADMLEADPENLGYLDFKCKVIGNKTGTRVTIILPSGQVIGDSFGETDHMENHIKRPEIMSALKGNQGISRRYSSTLDKNMMYVALPVIKDALIIAVLRTALSISIIDDKIRSVRNSIFLAILATILTAGAVSLLVSRHVARPIEEMKKEAAQFAQGNLKRRMAVPDSEELSELAVVMNIHSSALYDNHNQRMGTLIIFHDITRIKRLENMHKAFAANVSHELKTPLTSIMGFIETLQEMLKKKNIEQAGPFLNIIEKNVSRMVALINDLLSLSRLERLQGTHIRFEPHNLASLIRGAVKSCESAITAKNILLKVDCPGDMTPMADPILMEQALINLVDNAVKYSTENQVITIHAVKNEAFIDIIVQDKGCGIGIEHLPKIFNRLYRVDKSRSREEGGTGLGLAIVKHIVQYHHGKIDVQSTRDKGTAFKMSIPVT